MRVPVILPASLIALSLVGCSPTVPTPTADAPAPLPRAPLVSVANPMFASWNQFPVGTMIAVRSRTTTGGIDGESTSLVRSTLKAKSADEVVLSVTTQTRRYDGVETQSQPEEFRHARTMSLPEGTAPAATSLPGEAVTVAGRSFPCTREETVNPTSNGPAVVVTWLSDAVPGRLVKSSTVIDSAKRTTLLELVEFTQPK